MKRTSIVLVILGIVMTISGILTSRDLNHVNVVDDHARPIYVNRIRSFPWEAFLGGVFIVAGLVFYIADVRRNPKP
ncbi:hypothetical protein QG516_08580 [Pedobacter gandavensis]|uniref:hypothetical protein n=1 Tax=Pedobacter gandavensis TaxID=2679963 RepID=UPI00247AAAAA|nr:hypothetical protein [Pedobacter gandavensis]WGQ11705.1 hypothetical protein QG516_08580 [Pedobacter gandavensis]